MKKTLSLLLCVMVIFSCFSSFATTSVSANCSASDVLSVAKGEVGVISGYHQRNKYTLWLGKIPDYEDSGYGYPWCSTFVSWCANQAGCLDIITRTASCNVQWANTAGDKYYTSQGYIPKPGDLIFFDYGTSHSANSLDHVGFVEYYDSSKGIVHTIEGNYDNSVARVNRSYNSNDIYGFVSPNYSPQEPEDDFIDLGTDFYAFIEHQSTGMYLTNQDTNVAGEVPVGNRSQMWKFIRQANGAYALQSALNGYYMDVYALDEDNSNVYTWNEYLNTSNQQFYIYQEYDAYYFRPAHSSSRRLDMSSTEDHNLSIWSVGEDWPPQEFNIIKIDVNQNLPYNLGEVFYAYVEHQSSGLYLTNQHTNVVSDLPNGTQNQIWKFVRQKNASYSIQSLSNGYYLDVYGSFDENETNVYTWSEYTGALNQQFYVYYMYDAYYIRPAFTTSKMLDVSAIDNNLEIWATGEDWAPQEFNIIKINVFENLPLTLGDNFYAKIENSATHKYLTAIEGNVQGIDENCSKQQVWNFVKQSNNSYKLINCYDSGAMDVEDYAVAGSGSNIQTNVDWDTTAQLFFIYQMYGAFYIKPLCTDMVLDMSQTTYNLEVWDAGVDWPAQKFNIEKIDSNDIGVHTYSSKITKSPTCTENGTRTYTCDVCGDEYTESISSKGHVMVTDKAVAPSCSKTGLTEGKHCSECNTVIIKQNEVEALGHRAESNRTTVSTSDAGKITQVKYCSRCGEVVETREIIDGSVTSDPTEPATESTAIATNPTETTVTDPVETTSSEPTESKPVETTVTEPTESEATTITATVTTDNVTDPTETYTPNETESTEPSTPDETEPTEPSTPDETKPTEPSEDKGLLGDVNGNSKVNVKDATLIQKAAAKITKLTDAENLRADVNGDGKVNVKDATAIQKFAAKIETGFPIGMPIDG